MKIDYIRNMQAGYMRIVVDTPLSKMEEKMLENNTVDGILPVFWQQEDQHYLLRYDITGKQALDMVFENRMADENILKCLLSGVCIAVKQLERYLLQQDGLLLRPETIFWDYKTGMMYFCYCPGESENLQDRFRHLMEYILVKTDHKNLEAVELAYGVYDELQKPTFTLLNLQDYLYKICKSECKEPVKLEEQVQIERKREGDWKLREEKKIKEDSIKEESIKGKLMAWIKDKLPKRPQKKREEELIVFEPEMEEISGGLPTMLLAKKSSGIEGILKYDGEQALPDIEITAVPFLIGSDSVCDGIIDLPVISRQHAKITKVDDVYFIEDLNSTNGTTVDGGMLNYKTRISIKAGSRIAFANVTYVFR